MYFFLAIVIGMIDPQNFVHRVPPGWRFLTIIFYVIDGCVEFETIPTNHPIADSYPRWKNSLIDQAKKRRS
jgi:hypothetical protein